MRCVKTRVCCDPCVTVLLHSIDGWSLRLASLFVQAGKTSRGAVLVGSVSRSYVTLHSQHCGFSRKRKKKRPGSLVSQVTMLCELALHTLKQSSVTEGHCRAIDSLVVPSAESGRFDDSVLQIGELCAGMFT